MDKTVNHKECYCGRIKKDNVETKFYDVLCKFKVFLPTSVPRQGTDVGRKTLNLHRMS